MSFSDYFERNYMQKFELSKREKELIDLAKRYHDMCDSHDEKVCTGKNEYGEAMPQNNDQFISINRNAAQVRKSIIKLGEEKGFNKHEVSKAISEYLSP